VSACEALGYRRCPAAGAGSAACRTCGGEAWLTQDNLGGLAGFSPVHGVLAEIGRQPHAREFWAACDKALGSGGVLAAGFDQIEAVREAEERAEALRGAGGTPDRALAALTAARHRADATAAGVTAVQHARTAAAGSRSSPP